MIILEENKGIPRSIMFLMAIMAGLTVANLYYNQPLLEVISTELGVSQVLTNLITVITQIGYVLGLMFIIPSGDLFSRRKIILYSMSVAIITAAVIGLSHNIYLIWLASLLLGASSVIPQLFIPVASQFSRPENKARNMGYVLSGLLTGILGARVISGFVGDMLGWRAMFLIAACIMIVCCALCKFLMPDMQQNFKGTYPQLLKTVWSIYRTHPRIRLYSIRAGFGFGSMLAIWACLAFHIAGEPFNAGSDKVGILGLCGVAGALSASGMGKFIPKFGIRRMSAAGALLQMLAWSVAYIFNDSYAGLAVAIIIVDVGIQCQQLSNQSGCLQEVPEASNRANTIFMTTYFIGGSLGTFCAGLGWEAMGWAGVCVVGLSFAMVSLLVSVFEGKMLAGH